MLASAAATIGLASVYAGLRGCLGSGLDDQLDGGLAGSLVDAQCAACSPGGLLWLPMLAFLLPLLGVLGPWKEAQRPGLLTARFDQLLGSRGWAFVDDVAWQPYLPRCQHALPLPRLRLQGLLLPLLLLFLNLLAAILPQADPEPPSLLAHPPTPLLRTQAMLEQLQQHQMLDPETLEQLQQELARLAEEAQRGSFDARSWQHLDRLSEHMRQQSEEQARQLGASLAAAEQLAALAAAAAQESASDATSADGLAQAVAEWSASAAGLAPQQGQRLQQALREADDPALQAWRQALEEAVAAGHLSPQRHAELLDQGWCPNPSHSDSSQSSAQSQALADLAQHLQAISKELSAAAEAAGLSRPLAQGQSQMQQGMGSSIGRGPHAPSDLTFTEHRSFLLGGLDSLAPSQGYDPQATHRIDEVQGLAELDPEAAAPAQRADLQAWEASAADAQSVRVSPRHRMIVEAQFQRIQGSQHEHSPSP